MVESSRGGNAQAPWHKLNSKLYLRQYEDVIFDDKGLTRAAIGMLDVYGIPFRSLRRGIDVGNGAAARWPALIAPYIADTGELHWSEYAESPFQTIRDTIRAGREGNLERWAKHQADMASFHTGWADAVRRACLLGTPIAGSVFDLPPDDFDIGSMWFVAESITDQVTEHRAALRRFLGSVRVGCVALVGSMYGSTGWDSAGVALPALPIGPEVVMEIAEEAGYVDLQSYEVRSLQHTVRPLDSPFTYKSMGLVAGRRAA